MTLPFAVGIALAGNFEMLGLSSVWAGVVAGGAVLCAMRRRLATAAALVTVAFVLLGAARQHGELAVAIRGAALVGDGGARVARLRAVVRRVPLPNHPGDPAPRPPQHVVDLVAARGEEAWRPFTGGVALTLSSVVPDVLPGDEIELLASVRRPSGPRYPGGYDLRRALATDGVYLVAHAPGASVRVLQRGNTFGVRRIAAVIRSRLARVLRDRLPYREAEVCVAILLGHRPGVAAEDRARFTSSGLGHVLAVSGLHVAILVGIVGWMLRRVGLPGRAVAVLVAALAILYALVAGARPPVVRSAVMVVTYLAARVFERDRDGPNAVAFAALLILVAQPLSLFDAGFQLSFAAVTFLAFLFPVLEETWATLRGAPERWMDPGERTRRTMAAVRVRQAVFASTAAWIGVQPLLVHYLGVLNPWGIVSNVVMLPLVTLALATSFAFAVASALLGPIGWVLLPVVRVALAALLAGVEAFARLPMSAIWLASPGESWLLAYYAGALLLFAYARGTRAPASRATHMLSTLWARRAMFAAAGLVAVSVLAWWVIAASGASRPESPSLTVFDFGSDRAALLRDADGAFVLLNAGSPGRDVRLIQSVSGMAADELAAVVVTRDEPTHSTGLLKLARTCRIDVLAIHSGDRRGRSEELLACARGVRRSGGMVLNCLPGDELADPRNDTRVAWLAVRQGGRAVREAALVVCRAGSMRVALLDCDRFAGRSRGRVNVRIDPPEAGGVLLVVAGSGSASVVEAAVKSMRPDVVVMCASRVETAFRGPSAVLEVLRRTDTRVVVTAGTGSVRVVRRGEGYGVLVYDGGAWREHEDCADVNPAVDGDGRQPL